MGDHAGEGALHGVRVLDLGDEKASFCTKLLADLGADVIKVEPPGGDPARSFGPFYQDQRDPERSLYFWHYNTNKRSIVLDLDQPADRETLRPLIEGADILVDTFPVGYPAALGLDAAALRALNPRLIHAAITPYGQTGPRAGWKGNDLTAWAMGGVMSLCGEPDREPLRGVLGQAYHIAAFGTAIALLAALRHQRLTGEGRFIDVSLQEAVACFSEAASLNWIYKGEKTPRLGGGHVLAEPFAPFRCRDGWCFVAALSQPQWATFSTWLAGDGKAEDLTDDHYLPLMNRLAARDHVDAVIAGWAAEYGVDELFQLAQAQSLPFGPVNRVDQIAQDPHLAARGFWVPVDHPELGAAIPYPGAPYHFDRAGWAIRRRAPRLDEDREAILAEVAEAATGGDGAGAAGIATEPAPGGATSDRATIEPNAPNSGPAGPAPASGATPAATKALPLAGVRVVDFTWVLAGPFCARLLADLGAEVIKVEQPVTGCLLRIFPPFVGGSADLNKGGVFFLHNRNKRSLAVDLRSEEGREIVRRLIGWGDIVLENFSAGVMERLGMGYEDLRQIRPDVILIRMSGFGQTGPYSDYVSYHGTLTAMAGHTLIAGYPETGEPCGYQTSVSDYFGGLSGAVATLAAIEHRRRTGEGACVDLGQWEAVTSLIGPALLGYQLNGEILGPVGNRWIEGRRGPYGVYPCRGEDRWITLSAAEEDEWAALGQIAGSPAWSADPRFRTAADRDRHRTDLDPLIAAWTRDQDPFDLLERLQGAGIPAGVVQNGEDLVDRDDHLRERGYWIRYEQPDAGTATIDRGPAHLPESPVTVRYPSPKLGEHTREILRDVLGYGEAEIDRLIAAKRVQG